MISTISLKEHQIQFEEQYLSGHAAKSFSTKGRVRPEEPCEIRNEFQRDRDRILHSKAFRRLKHKTQVFVSPLGDHFRTRMTHALEVSQISRTIARALRLNEDLTEAIALGHDLGHTPFGHTGEDVLDELMSEGFRHNEQSVRVVSVIEDLNLTAETIDGLLNHTGKTKPMTLEGQIVKISDRIAYLNHDIDDSLRAKFMNIEDLPSECNEYFGTDHGSRITTMVKDLIENSIGKDEITMSEECLKYMNILRAWMFKNIYINSQAKTEENKARKVLTDLFEYYLNRLKITDGVVTQDELVLQRTVADYIAGMTDRYAVQQYKDRFIPMPMSFQADDGFLFKLAKKNKILCV